MSVHDDLHNLAHRHHDRLLELQRDLEAVARQHQDDGLPREAARILAAIWPLLQAYGRRDHRGSVCEDIAPHPRDMQ